MIVYIDEYRCRFGVEPICSALQFAPRTYYAAKARPPSPLDALEQAIWARSERGRRLDELVHHSDRLSPVNTCRFATPNDSPRPAP